MADDPTRPLPPARPPVTQAVTYVDTDELAWRQEVRERLRSLTTAITLVGILAAGALGVALWGLLRDDDGDGASLARVRALEERVDSLESESDESASRTEAAAIRERQRTLEQRLQTLTQQVRQPSADLEATRDALEATQQSIDQLEQRVDALEQQPIP
jgi:septal ring factor EnvC (AmiA/AmiB activator)